MKASSWFYSQSFNARLETPKFKVGDRVAYSVQFLESVGGAHTDMAHGRGLITGFKQLSSETMLAVIDWDRELPEVVNTHNLAHVGNNPRFVKV